MATLPRHSHGAGAAFDAFAHDAEDYYTVLPSDESMSDAEDEETVPPAPKFLTHRRDPVEELTSAFASTSATGVSAAIFTPIGSLNASSAHDKDVTRPAAAAAAPGVFSRGHGDDLRLSSRALEQHAARRSQLQDALDAAHNISTGKAIIEDSSSAPPSGEAPFRFQRPERVVLASPASMTGRVEGHGPEKESGRRRKPSGGELPTGADSEDDDGAVEPDPLYDDDADAADEKWVQTNICGERGEAGKEVTDATLCCPCCFVTVCMICDRHATFTNQYRATAAMNCRVKKEEILTYTTEEGAARTAMPFQTRQSLPEGSKTTSGQDLAQRLQTDEFFPVACSDCGTMVGVFDRDCYYHFFNVLPSNC